MPYQIFYHPEVKEDIAKLPRNIQERIRHSIEERLLKDPVAYGDPLKRTLKGYRKLRVGDYRVIYSVGKDRTFLTAENSFPTQQDYCKYD